MLKKLKRAALGARVPHEKGTAGMETVKMPVPTRVVLPMQQHIGAPCKPLVSVGQRVTLGQKIGDGQGLCAPVHASVSGTVVAVEELPHPGGTNVMSVVIENDGRDDLCPEIHPRQSIGDLDADALIRIIRDAGITSIAANRHHPA